MKTIWVVYDAEKKGSLNQCLGLARALNYLTPLLKPVPIRKFHPVTPPLLEWVLYKTHVISPIFKNDPKPDLIIGSGRRSAALCAYLKSYFQCKAVFVQNPYLPLNLFDVVIPPLHENIKGKNVIETLGCLHNTPPLVTPDQPMAQAHPRMTVLLGGDTRYYRYDISFATTLIDQMKAWQSMTHGVIYIAPSRRTRPDIIQHFQKNLPEAIIWDGQEPNPYLTWLTEADTFIVTGDSISMACDACYTGNPVYIAELPKPKAKWQAFHKQLYAQNYARPLDALTQQTPSLNWTPKKLDESTRIIPEVLTLLSR